MLKIYPYGYLNRIQSSRRLEQEARRNLELMWLVGRLAPDFKTLADFRADNAAAIKNVCREFIVLWRRWGLLTETTVAIDGSKFKAVNHRDRNFTSGKMQTRMQASPDGQVSLVDPDARSMASQGKGTGTVGYNVQSAVETKNQLIVAHEVTNVGSDRHQFKKMADAAREALDTEKITAIADRGYYSGEQKSWMGDSTLPL